MAYSQSWRVAGSVSIAFLRSGVFSRARRERNVQFVGDHLRDAVGIAVTQAHDAANITDHAFRPQCAEGDDLRNAALTVFLADVFDHFATARFAEVDVDIRRRNALGIEETFEEQPELERIDVRNAEHVGDQRTRRRTTAWPDRNAVLLRRNG